MTARQGPSGAFQSAASTPNRLTWRDDFSMVGGGTIPTSNNPLPFGDTNWRAIALGASGTIQGLATVAEPKHPGILAFTTNAAAIGRALYLYRGGNVSLGYQLANEFEQLEFIARLPNIDGVATLWGQADNVRSLQLNQMAVLYDASSAPAGQATLKFATSKAGVTLTSDTGIVPDFDFHQYTIGQDSSGKVSLKYDDVLVAENSGASVPTVEILNTIFGVETLIVGAKVMHLDFASYVSRDLGKRY